MCLLLTNTCEEVFVVSQQLIYVGIRINVEFWQLNFSFIKNILRAGFARILRAFQCQEKLFLFSVWRDLMGLPPL